MQSSNVSSPIQRIQVFFEPSDRAKICLESYDDNLGWYTAASLSIPLHQLPLLEQAIERMRALTANAQQAQGGNIIALPNLRH
ncbi:MAG TPA: hypothetical protein VK850_12205 [Candidatus Binatia bacterium]|nr:hypothetical protein [Candidatus Binatia bacterium]